jgi:TRAP-type C4-dicarboxylate transport system permease small subunit
MPAPSLDRLEQILRSGLGVLVSVLLAAISILCIVEVVLRYVFGESLAWYDEFVGYLLVWLTFFGAVLAQSHNQHIGVENLVERASPAFQKALRLTSHALLVGIHLVLLVYGTRLVLRFLDENAITLPVPMGVIYSVIPVSAALLLMVEAVHIARLVTTPTSGAPE